MDLVEIEGVAIRVVMPDIKRVGGQMVSELHLGFYHKLLSKQGIVKIRFLGDKASLVKDIAEGESVYVSFTVFGYDFDDDGAKNYSYLHGLNVVAK